MSIVARTDKTVVLDPRPAFCNGLQKDQETWKLRSGQFNLSQPYFWPKRDTPQRAKRRKTEPSSTEQQTLKTFQSLQPYFEQCLEEIIGAWPAIKDSLCEADDENVISQSNDSHMIDFVESAELVKVVKSFAFQLDPEQPTRTMILQDTNNIELPEIYNTIISNHSSQYVTLAVEPTLQRYLIPAKSTFLMGQLDDSMDTLGSYAQAQGGYDFIVIDPPWPNKSAHRSKNYDTLDIYTLFEIPMAKLLSPDALVAVWVTNRPKYKQFLTDKLFPSWNLEVVGEWHWMKMTTTGKPVMPLDSTHRKPYELLLVARNKASTSTIDVPEKLVFASVVSQHSRKPPLNDLISLFDSNHKDRRCLELFARCLAYNTTSWGNECLLFQHDSYFTCMNEHLSPETG